MSVRKKGDYYYYEFWIDNQRYSGAFNGKRGRPLAKSKPHARELEFSERQKARNGESSKEREKLKVFSTFVDTVYLPFAKENHQSPEHAEFRCEMLKAYFKNRRFNEFTPLLVERFIKDRLNTLTHRKNDSGEHLKRSPTTVNKEVSLLTSIFKMAMQEGVAQQNPCGMVRKSVKKQIPARRRRHRYLTLAEEATLFQKLQGKRLHVIPIARIALLTGMRKGEILGLRKEYINLSSEVRLVDLDGERWEIAPNWLLIHRTKNGDKRLIPMSKPVQAILSVLCGDVTTRYVFENPETGKPLLDIKRAFPGACQDAGLSNLTFHDLRHTWATRAAECGVVEPVRRDILGHKAVTLTGDYTHSTPEAQDRAMAAVAGYSRRFGSILAKSSPKQETGQSLKAVSC